MDQLADNLSNEITLSISDDHHVNDADARDDSANYSDVSLAYDDDASDDSSHIGCTFCQVEAQSVGSTKSRSDEAQERPSFLMRLPPEIRLNVYDYLFTDLTIKRQRRVADLREYHHWQNWPKNDFSAYRNLILTCKEVHDEAKSLWENMYIRHCCFYFWKVPDFFRVAKQLEALGEPYQRMSYALRTRPFVEIGEHDAELVDNEAEKLMTQQPGFPGDDGDYANFHWDWPRFRFDLGLGIHTLRPGERITYEIYQVGTGRHVVVRAEYPGLEKCSIVVHETGAFSGGDRMQYLLMSGKMGDVCWRWYDAPAVHAQLQIWEEWQRQGFPFGCLEKSDIVLSWRSKAMSGGDKAWLALGGDSDHLENMDYMAYMLGLHNWLMADGRLRP